jgi:hypothetical protein
VGRAEHAGPADDATVEQLARDHAGLDGLADAHVVGDQQPHRLEAQGHDQRYELVRPGSDRDVPKGAERRRARAQAQSCGIEQKARCCGIGDRAWVGARERSRLDLLFERQEEADLLMVRPGERLQPDQARQGRGQRYPITTARADQ